MKTKTHARAGRLTANHNEAQVRDAREGKGLKVKTSVKAGKLFLARTQLRYESPVKRSRALRGATVRSIG